MRRLNDRHPWSHNDAFHPWVLTELPTRRGRAVDVGCGRRELLALLALLAQLAQYFDRARGIDSDAAMREASLSRCAGLSNVTVDAADLGDLPEGADLVTMIAVLHHLNLDTAPGQVRAELRPGGRFLCVGLARPASFIDRARDMASTVTNPLTGFLRHPWVAREPPDPAPFPARDPEDTFEQVRAALRREMPGAEMRHRLAFRYTIVWTKPQVT